MAQQPFNHRDPVHPLRQSRIGDHRHRLPQQRPQPEVTGETGEGWRRQVVFPDRVGPGPAQSYPCRFASDQRSSAFCVVKYRAIARTRTTLAAWRCSRGPSATAILETPSSLGSRQSRRTCSSRALFVNKRAVKLILLGLPSTRDGKWMMPLCVTRHSVALNVSSPSSQRGISARDRNAHSASTHASTLEVTLRVTLNATLSRYRVRSALQLRFGNGRISQPVPSPDIRLASSEGSGILRLVWCRAR